MKSDDEEIAKNDSRVVNLIAKWLQLFILQMDSSEWVARRMQSHKKGTLEAFYFLVASPQTLITNTITVWAAPIEIRFLPFLDSLSTDSFNMLPKRYIHS